MTLMKFRKAFKAATEVYQNTNFDYPVGTLQSDIGMKGGASYIRIFWGKDVADLHTHRAKAWDNFAEEVQQTINDLAPYRRKIETIIQNAATCKQIIQDFGSMKKWVNYVAKENEKDVLFKPSLEEECQRKFKGIGEMTRKWVAYVFYQGKSKPEIKYEEVEL